MQLDALRQDIDKRDNGTVFEYPRFKREDDAPDSRAWGTLTIAKWQNPKHLKRVAELYAERREELRAADEELAAKITADIELRAICDTILIGWENIWVYDELIPYSPDAAFLLLSNPEYAKFYQQVLLRAQSEAPYRFVEDAAGKKT